MSSRDESFATVEAPQRAARGRLLWHALAMLAAAVLAWLIFTAYRQPEFILEFAGMRLC
ncbi:MAG TPA: hypothetical protein VF059_09450 [Casimicrobiaceae bacterium]